MDEIVLQPEDASENDESRDSETKALDEATFEPQAHVERTGDYKQSEAIQAAFETVTTNATASNKVEAAPPKEGGTGGDEQQIAEQDQSKAGQEPKVSEGPFEPDSDSGNDRKDGSEYNTDA